MVRVSGVSQIHAAVQGNSERVAFSFTLGLRTEQNPYSGELAAMACALRSLPAMRDRNVTVITSNKAAVLSLGNPRQQSGQEYVQLIYEVIEKLRQSGNRVVIEWMPMNEDHELLKLAKGERQATKNCAWPQRHFPRMRSTTFNIEKRKLKA